MSPIISIDNLSVAHERGGARTQVIADLDLEIAPQEFVAIIGASGVGKSSLLRVLMGLHPAAAGDVSIGATSGAERPMALVFQDARLLPWRRVLANAAFGLEKTELPHAEREARALAVRPAILLMDEPFSAVDAPTRRNLQDELLRLRQTFNKTIVFVTHDIDEAVYLADRVVALKGAPASVAASLRIPVPRPRRREDPTLTALCRELMAILHSTN
jgi:NitT/TauT family transport system ATP-binding protein